MLESRVLYRGAPNKTATRCKKKTETTQTTFPKNKIKLIPYQNPKKYTNWLENKIGMRRRYC